MPTNKWKEEMRDRSPHITDVDNLSAFTISNQHYYKNGSEFGYPGKRAVPVTYSGGYGTIEQSAKPGAFFRVGPNAGYADSLWATDRWWDVDNPPNLDWIKVLGYATDKNTNQDYLILDSDYTGGDLHIGKGVPEGISASNGGVTLIPRFGIWSDTKFDWNSFVHWDGQGTNAWVKESIDT